MDYFWFQESWKFSADGFKVNTHLLYNKEAQLLPLFTLPTLFSEEQSNHKDEEHCMLNFISVQERLTKQIAEAVLKAIEPRGVAVVCEGV